MFWKQGKWAALDSDQSSVPSLPTLSLRFSFSLIIKEDHSPSRGQTELLSLVYVQPRPPARRSSAVTASHTVAKRVEQPADHMAPRVSWAVALLTLGIATEGHQGSQTPGDGERRWSGPSWCSDGLGEAEGGRWGWSWPSCGRCFWAPAACCRTRSWPPPARSPAALPRPWSRRLREKAAKSTCTFEKEEKIYNL